MKTILLGLFLILSFTSCKKDQKCWTCTFGATNGQTRPPERVCTDGEEPGVFYDSAGTPWNSQCTPD